MMWSSATAGPLGTQRPRHYSPFKSSSYIVSSRPVRLQRVAAPERRCEATAADAASSKAAPADAGSLYQQLDQACLDLKRAPPSEKQQWSGEILSAMQALKQAGSLPKWGAAAEKGFQRRNVALWELKRVGIANPEAVGTPSVRNDAAFLITVVGTTSVAAVAGGFLPGDWGFFVPYLVGGISLGVLAVGSTAPGLLQFFIDKFSRVFPDYRERVLQHEAAHFLAGYLVGVPVTGYSLDIGKAHTDFAEAALQKRLIEGNLDDDQIHKFSILAMAGATAEAIFQEQVVGQTADLVDLQRILLRAQNKLSNAQQQNMTRWAVYEAGSLLKLYEKEYKALQEAMRRGASVPECVKAVEEAS